MRQQRNLRVIYPFVVTQSVEYIQQTLLAIFLEKSPSSIQYIFSKSSVYPQYFSNIKYSEQ